MGVRCEDPFAQEKSDALLKMAALGKSEVLKAIAKSCDDSMDTMETDKAKITCLEDCPFKESVITEVGEGSFTMDSVVCVAAKK